MKSTESERITFRLIEAHQEQTVQLLQKMIGYHTVTPEERAETDQFIAHQDFLQKFLQDMQISDLERWEVNVSDLDTFPGSGVLPGRDMSRMPILTGKFPGSGGGKSLILNGHYDVVPTGKIENWTHAPFSGEILDGKLYGRGACDMKGGIAAMLMALKCIREAGISLKGDITVQIVPDEEMSCMGTLACCQRGYTADAALIPEPTDMKVLVAMRGSLYGKIKVRGRAGHAEEEQPHWSEGGGVNAIYKALKIVSALQDLAEEWRTRPDKQHPYLPPDFVLATGINSKGWEVTIPEEAEITFGSMFIPAIENTREEIEDQVRRAANADPWMRENPPEFHFQDAWWYAAEISPEEPIVQLGLQALREFGYPEELCGFGSLTDAIHLINYSKIPTISIGPHTQPAHMADEFVDTAELFALTKIIALIILRWCGVS